MVYRCIPENELERETYPFNSGGFGKVYKAKWKGKVCVLKTPHVLHVKTKDKDKIMNEALILARLEHENIIGFYGVCEDSSILMEYIPKGDLHEFIVNGEHEVPLHIRFKLIYDVASGMEYLHKESILHKDLKSSNVLISDHYSAKINDFGLSKLRQLSRSSSASNSQNGTISHIPPEKFISFDAPTDYSYDVYSFAMLIYEAWSAKLLYEDCAYPVIISLVSDGKRPSTESLDTDMPCYDKMINLLKRCWHQDPSNRPHFSDIVAGLVKMRFSEETFFSCLEQSIRAFNVLLDPENSCNSELSSLNINEPISTSLDINTNFSSRSSGEVKEMNFNTNNLDVSKSYVKTPFGSDDSTMPLIDNYSKYMVSSELSSTFNSPVMQETHSFQVTNENKIELNILEDEQRFDSTSQNELHDSKIQEGCACDKKQKPVKKSSGMNNKKVKNRASCGNLYPISIQQIGNHNEVNFQAYVPVRKEKKNL